MAEEGSLDNEYLEIMAAIKNKIKEKMFVPSGRSWKLKRRRGKKLQDNIQCYIEEDDTAVGWENNDKD